MTTRLKLLLLEDREDDKELVLMELEKDGFEVECRQVDNEADYVRALSPDYDVILADFSMPQFDALRALAILRERALEVPFIVVSGSISEEVAVECMRLGASDYLLKDRLNRLGGSIRNTINYHQARKDTRQAQSDLLIKNWAVASSISAVAITDLDGTITYVNDALLDQWGYDNADHLVGKHFEILWQTGKQVESLLQHLNDKGKWRGEMVAIRQDGGIIYTEVSTSVVLDEDENPVCLMGTFIDITDRKQAELALRESELRFRQIAENIYEMVFLTDLQDGSTLYVNPAFERIWGYPMVRAYQVGAKIASQTIYPEDEARVRKAWDMQDKKMTPFDETYRIIRSDNEVRWIRDRSWIVFDENHTPYRRVSIVEDVTEEKKSQELRRDAEQLANELANEKKLREMKSRFLSTVTHDFRNPLSSIKLAIETMLMYSDRYDEERRAAKLHSMQEQVTRMNELMEDVLTVGQLDSGMSIFQPVEDNLEAFCRNIIAELRSLYQKTHFLEYYSEGETFKIHFDKNLMRRIIDNLISNAAKYSPNGTTIRFEIKQIDEFIVIKIVDQGIGIPPEDAERIFEMFGRAGNVGSTKGTGIGLPIVKQSVELHGGKITVHSKEGNGSTFNIVLPLLTDK